MSGYYESGEDEAREGFETGALDEIEEALNKAFPPHKFDVKSYPGKKRNSGVIAIDGEEFPFTDFDYSFDPSTYGDTGNVTITLDIHGHKIEIEMEMADNSLDPKSLAKMRTALLYLKRPAMGKVLAKYSLVGK